MQANLVIRQSPSSEWEYFQGSAEQQCSLTSCPHEIKMFHNWMKSAYFRLRHRIAAQIGCTQRAFGERTAH